MVSLLTELRRRPEALIILLTDFRALPNASGHLNYVANSWYWASRFYFECNGRKYQNNFVVWRNVKILSMRSSDRAGYYCSQVTWWAQYEGLCLTLVPSFVILAYYSGLAMLVSVEDQIRV